MTNETYNKLASELKARTTFHRANQWERILARESIGLPIGKGARAIATRKLRLPLLLLAAQIQREIAPQLESAREIDSFIASGKSLVGWLKEKTTPAKLPAWARLQAPLLPVGMPMPANVCLSPAFNV